jgi:hypothetical protein
LIASARLVRNVLIIGLMIVVGYLVGFRFQAGVIPALACVALVAAFGFALGWIFAFVSLVVRGAETAQTAGFVLLFPLVFASSPTATVFACLGRSRRRPICDRLRTVATARLH